MSYLHRMTFFPCYSKANVTLFLLLHSFNAFVYFVRANSNNLFIYLFLFLFVSIVSSRSHAHNDHMTTDNANVNVAFFRLYACFLFVVWMHTCYREIIKDVSVTLVPLPFDKIENNSNETKKVSFIYIFKLIWITNLHIVWRIFLKKYWNCCFFFRSKSVRRRQQYKVRTTWIRHQITTKTTVRITWNLTEMNLMWKVLF